MDTIKRILVVVFVSMALSLMLVGTTSAGCGLTHPSLHVELIGSTDSQMLGETEYFFAVYAINDKDCTFCDPAEDLNIIFQVDKGEIVSTNKYSFDSCTVDASNTLATFYRGNVKEKESLMGYIWLKTPTSGSFTITVDGIEVETDGGCIVNSNSITETYSIYSGLSEREYFAKLAEQRAETLTKYKEMYLSVLGMSGGSWEEYTNRQIAEAMALSIQFTAEVGNSINVDPTSANDAAKGMYAIFTDEIPFLGAPLRTFESILNVGTGMCEHLINYVAYYDYHEIGLMDELITLYNEEATAWRNCDDGGVALKKIFDDEVDHLQGNWISLYKTSSDLKNTAIQREEVGNVALFSSIVTFAFNDAFQTIPLLRASVEAVCNTPQSSDFTPLDLCMVLDRSGSMDESMGGKTRMQGVKEAAKGVVNVLLPQDRVSIDSFSDTATANVDLTSDFNAVKTKINAITAGGGTSFGAGLEAALDQFKAHGNPDHNPAILFMSDGEHNRAPDPEAYVTQCKNKGIPIFTVGFASSESEVDVTKLKMMSEETGGEYLFVSEIFDLQNIFLRLQHKASGWESVAAYVGEVDEGETITAGTFYVDPAIDNLRVTLNWPGSNLDLELFDPSSRQVDFGASNVIYSGDTKPEYVIIKDPQSGYWTAKVYGKSIGSSEEYYVLVTKYVPEPTMDIQAEIRNIWTSDIISPIVLFGKDANLGQVLQADLDDDLFSDPLPSYDDRCLGDKNYDKSVISRFGEGDDKVRIVLDITGGTGFKPGSEGYIKILNPEYKITKIYGHSDYVGVQPPTMSLGTPTISTDYSGFGVVIDMEEGSVSWQGRGTCPACACRENTFRMEFLVEKVSIPADSVIFADDFDTYATGSFPSSGAWNLKYNGMGDSYQIVDNAQSVSPPNSLKLEGKANWAASADHPLAETPDQVIYEVDVKVTQPGSSVKNYPDAAIGLANPNIGTWGTRYAGVIFGNAENRVIQPGNIPFNFDQWYHIKVKADMNNGVYDVWLDDQLIASDISTSSNGDYTDIRLEGGNNAHTRVWFDNVKVYRGDYPFHELNGWLKGNQPPVNPTLSPDKPEPQSAGTAITWTASATDPDGDPLYYLFRLKGPKTGNSWTIMRDWSTDNTWTWYTSSAGGDTDVSGWSKLDISVWIRDGHHAPSDCYDLEKIYFDYYIYKFIG